MATSGQTILELSSDDIINAAYRKLVVIGEGQTANANQLITGRSALNNIVAEFRVLGMSMWARKTYYLVMVPGQADYVFGVGMAQNTPYPFKIYSQEMMLAPDFASKINMNVMSFTDFAMLPAATGVPVNMTYRPDINQGTISVWPTPDTSVPTGTKIQLIYQAPFEYFINGVDTPDFPEEWNNALIYTLALTLSDEVGKSMQDRQWIEKQADKHLNTALSGGTEEASMFIQRDWRQ